MFDKFDPTITIFIKVVVLFARFYDCLCNTRYIKCTIWYSWLPRTSRSGVPFPCLINGGTTIGYKSELHDVFSSKFICSKNENTVTFHGDFTCTRLTDSQTCNKDDRSCKEYSVDWNFDRCSFSCSQLIWYQFYESETMFRSLGDYPQPVEGGLCPEESHAINQNSTTVGHNISESSEKFNNSTGDVDPGNRQSPHSGTSILMQSVIGTVAGGILVLVVLTVIFCKLAKARKCAGCENASTLDSSTSSSELRKNETKSSSGEDLEREIYHTLEEMDDLGEHRPDLGDGDEQGYNIISECDTGGRNLDERRKEMGCRPLPMPPNSASERRLITSKSLSESSAGPSMASNSTAEIDEFEFGPCSSKPPIITGKPMSFTEPFSCFPPPRPHVRVRENLKFMGLVKLKQDQAMIGHETEVNLIRTHNGSLELVKDQDKITAFTEYYTSLQLIKQKDGCVGVVGLLERRVGQARDKSIAGQHLPNDSGEYLTLDAETASFNSNAFNGEWKSRKDEDDKPNPYIVYFGSVELDEGVSVNPCDYLTVRDIDPIDLPFGNGGYLTLTDLDDINLTTRYQDMDTDL